MRKKIKNAIILSITAAAFILWCISVVTIDSTTKIPFCTFILSSGWLFAFMWANGWMDN